MSKRLVIIARYNENIEWVNQLKDNILIYNKGDKFDYNFPRQDIPNIGREAETFIRGIVDTYQSLNQYQSVIFLQGNPFEHCPNLFDFLNSIQELNSYVPLTKSITTHNLPEDGYILGNSLHIFERLIGNEKTKLECEIFDVAKNSYIKNENELSEILYICTMLNLKYKSAKITWSTGAQYYVPVKFILNKSLYWWQEFHKLSILAHTYYDYQPFAYIVERIWPLIWEYSDLSLPEHYQDKVC